LSESLSRFRCRRRRWRCASFDRRRDHLEGL